VHDDAGLEDFRGDALVWWFDPDPSRPSPIPAHAHGRIRRKPLHLPRFRTRNDKSDAFQKELLIHTNYGSYAVKRVRFANEAGSDQGGGRSTCSGRHPEHTARVTRACFRYITERPNGFTRACPRPPAGHIQRSRRCRDPADSHVSATVYEAGPEHPSQSLTRWLWPCRSLSPAVRGTRGPHPARFPTRRGIPWWNERET
jgi:hypothetical protein